MINIVTVDTASVISTAFGLELIHQSLCQAYKIRSKIDLINMKKHIFLHIFTKFLGPIWHPRALD